MLLFRQIVSQTKQNFGFPQLTCCLKSEEKGKKKTIEEHAKNIETSWNLPWLEVIVIECLYHDYHF